MSRLLPAVLVSLALASAGVLAACGSSDSSSSTSTAAPAAAATTSSGTGGATAPASGTVAISMKDIAFNPKTATAKIGEKVVWTNDDAVQHDVVAKSGATFKSKLFGQGATYAFTPTKAGTISYVCTIHPGMDGTLVVSK
jgi:plastocyanin